MLNSNSNSNSTAPPPPPPPPGSGYDLLSISDAASVDLGPTLPDSDTQPALPIPDNLVARPEGAPGQSEVQVQAEAEAEAELATVRAS